MSGLRSIVAFDLRRRSLRSTARSSCAAVVAGSISSTSSISLFSRNEWRSSMSDSSRSTSVRAVATSAYVRTPVCVPLVMRSLTSSSSCSSATDKVFPFLWPGAQFTSLFEVEGTRERPRVQYVRPTPLFHGSARPSIHFTHQRGHSTTSGTYDSGVSAEEPKLLGDLPRRRPGNRSSKRPVRQRRTEPIPPAEPSRITAGEAATEPLRLAVGAAEAGLKVASRVTGELIRRLPRL